MKNIPINIRATVCCGICNMEIEVELTELFSDNNMWDDRDVERQLEQEGWIFDGEENWICENCKQPEDFEIEEEDV
jgi:transcription elongation factor Elf1